MTDAELVEFAREFREGILAGVRQEPELDGVLAAGGGVVVNTISRPQPITTTRLTQELLSAIRKKHKSPGLAGPRLRVLRNPVQVLRTAIFAPRILARGRRSSSA